MLKWSEPDFVEFFGVAATSEDDGFEHKFEVARDGLRLVVTLFDFEQAVYVSVFRDSLSAPIFTVRRELCTHAHITGSADARRCFEAGKPKHPVTNMGVPPVLVRGVRVYVEPHFQVELIEAKYGTA